MDLLPIAEDIESILRSSSIHREVNALQTKKIVAHCLLLQKRLTAMHANPPEEMTRAEMLKFAGDLGSSIRESFVSHRALLESVAMELLDGRYTLSHLLELVICRSEALLLAALEPGRRERSFARHAREFYDVRRLALTRELDKPILSYSLHETLRALYSVYVHTGEGEYRSQLVSYTELLLTRMRTILITSATGEVFDVAACRERDSQRRHGVYFVRSQEFLRTATLIDYWLTWWFNSPQIAGTVVEAPPRAAITKDRLRCVRQWLLRFASQYIDQDTQMATVAGLMRAGEMEFYKDMVPGSVVSEPDVMAYYRRAKFLRATEQALWPVCRVIKDSLADEANFEASPSGHPYSQQEHPQFCSAALSVLTSQLRMASNYVQPRDIIIADETALRERASFLNPDQVPWPVLVVCCNRLQVWRNGSLYMYNSVLDSLCVWFATVEHELNNTIGKYKVDRLIDQVFHFDETPRSALERHHPELKRNFGMDSAHADVPSIRRPIKFAEDLPERPAARRRGVVEID